MGMVVVLPCLHSAVGRLGLGSAEWLNLQQSGQNSVSAAQGFQ